MFTNLEIGGFCQLSKMLTDTVTRCVTRPFFLSPAQSTTTTNKGAAATAYITGIQAALAGELDSYLSSCGYHRYIRGRCSHFIQYLCGIIKSDIINDCIRNATAVCNPRQNSVRDKMQEKYFLLEKQFCWTKICQKKIVSDVVSDFQCAK